MDDVALAVQLNKATVYHYYDTKAQILFELCLGALTDVIEKLQMSPEGLSPAEALAEYTHSVFEVIAAAPTRALVYFQESPFLDEWLSKEQVDVIREREHTFELHLRRIVERGVADGTFRDVDTRLAALAFSGMTNWFCRWYHRDGLLSADTIAAQFVDLIFAGLLTDKVSRPASSLSPPPSAQAVAGVKRTAPRRRRASDTRS
jgi:AcrR family transcriptional regulator